MSHKTSAEVRRVAMIGGVVDDRSADLMQDHRQSDHSRETGTTVLSPSDGASSHQWRWSRRPRTTHGCRD